MINKQDPTQKISNVVEPTTSNTKVEPELKPIETPKMRPPTDIEVKLDSRRKIESQKLKSR